MANTVIYQRDVKTGVLFPIKLIDNSDGTYSKYNAPPFLERDAHPWGKGSLTTDGTQYGAEATNATETLTDVEAAVAMYQPAGYTLVELECGLTMAVKSSGAAKNVLYQWLISDDGITYAALSALTTVTTPNTTYVDQFVGGRFLPIANALLAGSVFYLKCQIKTGAGTGETAYAKIKNNSYVTMRYRR